MAYCQIWQRTSPGNSIILKERLSDLFSADEELRFACVVGYSSSVDVNSEVGLGFRLSLCSRRSTFEASAVSKSLNRILSRAI